MVEKNKQLIKNQKMALVLLGVVLLAGVGTFVGLLISGRIGAITPIDTVYDEYELVVIDELDSSNTDDLEDTLTYAWYRARVSNLEPEEIEDLTWSDFSADGSGDDKKPDEDYVYIVHIYDATSPDVIETYWCSDSRIFEGKMPLLSLGPNTIPMYNATEDTAIVAYARDGGVTVNRTDDREWHVHWTTLDGSEGSAGNYTTDEGYKGYFDPSTNKWNTIVVKFTFNVTASTSYVELQDSYTNRETASGVYLYVELDVDLFGMLDTEWKFSSVLGSTFEAVTIHIGYGNADSFTAWDSQS